MGHMLFTVIPEKGHINPCIGVAQYLRARRHRISFWAACDITEQLTAAGLGNFVGNDEAGPPPDINRGAFFADKVKDRIWLRNWIKSLLVDNTSEQVEPIRQVIRNTQPDVVVTDPMVYAAAIASELEGVPWAAVSNSLNPVIPDELDSALLQTLRWASEARQELFAGYGLTAEFRSADLISPHLTVAFTTKELVGTDVPGVHMVGPSLPKDARGDETDFPWEDLDSDRPLIYMSFGSQIYYQPKIFRTVIDATRGKEVQLVLSVAELLGTETLGPLPEYVIAASYVPQLEILRKADAMITHGGANSVMEAIAMGVPLLVSPVCNDQHHQSFFVENSGVGRHLDLSAATPNECWGVLQSLLEPGPIRDSMDSVALSYRTDGAKRAAELVESLLP